MLGWLRSKRKKDPLEQLVEALGEEELPSFPALVLEALGLLRDPTRSLADVGARLRADPGVSARVLRIANSPAYALRMPVQSVEQAVALLGKTEIESMLLSIGASGVVCGAGAPFIDHTAFWKAASHRAAVARQLARRIHPATQSESFTAALLSDISVPLIAKHKGAPYADLRVRAQASGIDFHAVEHAELGFHHGFISGALARRWCFPERLTDAMGSHHDQASEALLPAVALASTLDEADPERAEARLVSVAKAFGLDPVQTVAIVRDAATAASSLASAFA